MIDILIGQKTQGDKAVLSRPIKSNRGFAIHTAIDPVTENTIRIITN